MVNHSKNLCFLGGILFIKKLDFCLFLHPLRVHFKRDEKLVSKKGKNENLSQINSKPPNDRKLRGNCKNLIFDK